MWRRELNNSYKNKYNYNQIYNMNQTKDPNTNNTRLNYYMLYTYFNDLYDIYIKEYIMRNKINILSVDNCEVDNIIYFLSKYLLYQSDQNNIETNIFVYSGDMDILQLNNTRVCIKSFKEEPLISKYKYHMINKIIFGNSVDNIKSILRDTTIDDKEYRDTLKQYIANEQWDELINHILKKPELIDYYNHNKKLISYQCIPLVQKMKIVNTIEPLFSNYYS
jgi:hypothetical protein